MATDIEQRVVQMRFDNAQFEKGIAQSYNSLDKFEKKLSFRGATKGLQEVQAAANQVSLENLSNQTEGVSVKFDHMAVVAMSALNRVTNAAITAGTNLAKALTIEPVMTGFQEYELKLNSIQTILANTKRHGSTMEDVSQALDELNHYADKTIYNFGQMTTAIGMFTTAGIELETSVNAVKGISNLAAFVGAPASDASRAMYQLSQGLATGYINLRDWMSLENTAGMSGIEFQERLKATARILGKNVDVMIEKNGSFRESLKEGWLSTEVLTETLKQFAGEVDEAYLRQQGWTEAQIDSIMELGRTATESATVVKSFTQLLDTLKESAQSGWAESWEIIIGGLDEAKSLWTNVNNVIGGMLEAQAKQRNEMLRGWAELGGRNIAIEALSRAFKNFLSVLEAVNSAIRDIFPPMTAERLYNITFQIYEFIYALTPSEKAVNTLRVAVKGLLLPIKFVTTAIEIAIAAFGQLVKKGFKMVDAILSWPSQFATVREALADLIGEDRANRFMDSLAVLGEKVSGVFGRFADGVRNAVAQLSKMSGGVNPLLVILETLHSMVASMGGWLLDRLLDGFEALVNLDFSWLSSGLAIAGKLLNAFVKDFDFSSPIAFFKSLVGAIQSLITNLKEMVGTFDFGPVFDKITSVGGRFGQVIVQITQAIQELIGRLTPAKILVFSFGASLVWMFFNIAQAISMFSKVAKGVLGIIKGVGDVMSAVADRIRGNKLLQIALAIGALAAALIVLGTVDPERLKGATIALVSIMGALLVFTAGMAAINKFLLSTPELAKNLQQIGVAMMAMGASVLLLAGAIAILSQVDLTGIGAKLLALGVLLAAMVGAAVLIGKFAKDFDKTAIYVLSFSASILLLAFSLDKISKLDLAGTAPNLLILAAAMGLFSLVSRAMSKVKFSSMAGLTLFVFDILFFAGVLSLLSKMDATTLVNGVVNAIPIFAALGALALVVRLAGGQASKMGGQLILIAGAIVILSFVIEKIGAMDQATISKGMGVVAGTLTLFSAIMLISAISSRSMKVGSSFMGMAAAILILGLAIDYIGHLDPGTIVKGTAVVSVLLILFGVINQTGNAANSAKSSIIAMSVCLGLLVASLAILTLLDFNDLMGSALALGTVMAAMGLMLKGAQNLKMGSAMGSILMLISVVSMLGLMFKYLDGTDPKSTLSSATGIGIVLAALNLSFGQVKIKTGDTKQLFITVGAMVTLLAGVSLVFGLLNRFGGGEATIQKAVAIGLVLGALSLSFNAIKAQTGNPADLFTTIGAMITLLGGVATIFGLLNQFSNGDGPIQKAAAISLILLALSASARILEGTKPPQNVVVILGSMLGMLTMATIVVAILNAMPLNEGLLDKVVALSVLLGVMTGVIAALSAVGLGLSMLGSVAGPALAGIGTAMLMIAGMIAFILLVGAAFAHIEELTPALDAAEEVFPRIGAVIGGFFGSIIGSFIGSGIGQAIEELGTSLTNFATNVQGFLGLKVEQDTVDAIARLAQVVLMLTAADFIDAINIFSGGSSIISFGKELEEFGPHFAAFANSLSGIPIAETIAASGAMQSIGNVLASIPTEGGLLEGLFGKKSLDDFGSGLTTLAEGISSYAAIVAESGIDQDTVDTTNAITASLIDLANSVPKTGALVDFLGGNDIGKFGEQLASFSGSLIDVFKNFKDAGVDKELTQVVADCGSILVDLANSVPKTGTLVTFLGGHDIGKFGEQLALYAVGLGGFFMALEDVKIDQDVAEAAKKAGEVMVELAELVPNTGVLVTFLGEKDIGKFGLQIGQYGAGLASFFTALGNSGINANMIQLSKDAGVGFTEIAAALGTNTGISTWFADTDLGVFGDEIKKLGYALAGYYEKVADISWSSVNTSVNELKRIAELAPLIRDVDRTDGNNFKIFITSLANSGVTGFTETFEQAEETMSSSIYNTLSSAMNTVKSNLAANPQNYGFIVDAMVSGLESRRDYLTNSVHAQVVAIRTTVETNTEFLRAIGRYIMESITNAFKSSSELLKSAVNKVMSDLLTATNTALGISGVSSSKFYNIGSYCMTGFINGLQQNSRRLYDSVTNLGTQAVNKFANATGVASPSKKFAEIGKFSVLGFVNGIRDYTKLGDEAMVKMGASLLDSIKAFFEIKSPSRVTRDEVGRYIVEGIAEGIEKDTSAEDAARLKAQNIVNAFQTEFDKLSTSLDTANLEYELWGKLNPDASEADALKAEMDILNKRLESQARTLALADAQYQATLKELGADAQETQEAYNKYLQEKINLADLAAQLSEIRQSKIDEQQAAQRTAFQEYSRLVQEEYQTLKELGFTDEEFISYAKEASGWTGEKVDAGGPTDIQTIMDEYYKLATDGAGKVEVIIQEAVVKNTEEAMVGANEAATKGGTKAGTSYSNAMGDAVKSNLPPVIKSAVEGATSGSGKDIGAGTVEGFVNGVNSKAEDAKNSVLNWLGIQPYEAVRSYNDEHSPSRLYATSGQNCVLGFIQGLDAVGAQATNTTTTIATNAFNAVKNFEPQYRNIGSQMMSGLASGINSGGSSVIQAATSIARQAIAATEAILGIHSPSREYIRIGKMIDQGLSNGILDNYGIVEGSLTKLQTGISDMEGTVLRPVVDTSSIDSAYNKVKDFDREAHDAFLKSYSGYLRFDAAGNVIPWGYANSSGYEGKYIKLDDASMERVMKMIHEEGYIGGAGDFQNEELNKLLKTFWDSAETGDIRKDNEDDWKNAPTYSIVQNNYSPKALNTAQIARNTKTATVQFANKVSSTFKSLNQSSQRKDKPRFPGAVTIMGGGLPRSIQ